MSTTLIFLLKEQGILLVLAIKDAHRQVSEQIKSELTSDSRLLDEYEDLEISTNGRSKSSSKSRTVLKSRITTKTAFAHNELIRQVIGPQKIGAEYLTLSCLNKEEAASVMLSELKPQFSQFLRHSKKANAMYSRKNWSRFFLVHTTQQQILVRKF